MISPDGRASLEDTLELLSDPDAMRELADAQRATGPAQRQLERLTEGTAAAIVEFVLSALVDNQLRPRDR